MKGMAHQAQLRDYQLDMLDRLNKVWQRCRSVLVQMPTGTGKTVLLAKAIEQTLTSKRNGVLVVAHRKELLDQIRDTIQEFGIDERQVKVESIQRLSRHLQEVEMEPNLVVVDEAHHALAKTYKMLWERWPQAKFLGLTATPCRLSGEPFTDLFDTLLQSWTIQEFIDKGWLSDFEYVSASLENPMMRHVMSLKKRGASGDYQEKETAMVLDVPESLEHLYNTYKTFADGKKGIIYAINREHAIHLADYYQQQGICCCEIDSKTPAKERERMIEDYRKGNIQILISVDIFGEGFNVPEVEFIQLARPTLSLSKYLQQIGRGMRVSPGKPHVTILDNVGLYLSFGMPTDSRNWQQMFMGMEAGKAHPEGAQAQQYLERTVQEKELVNLQMVRVKHQGERKSGLEIFEENGKFGVKKDGRVTCIAKFERIERLPDDSEYFAIATWAFNKNRELPYLLHRKVKTVIDFNGIDQKAIMTDSDIKDMGNGFFLYQGEWGQSVWDVKSCIARIEIPHTEKLGYIEIISDGDGKYYVRGKTRNLYGITFRKAEVLYNRYITIIKQTLIINSDPTIGYEIYGYRGNQIIVQLKWHPRKEYQLVNLNGTFGKKMTHLDAQCKEKFYVGDMFLRRVGGARI